MTFFCTVKLVHIISNLNVEGAELMLKRLASDPLFRAQGFEHHIVSLRDEGVLGPILKAKGVTVHALNADDVASMPLVFFRLWCLIHRTIPDVV